MRNLFNFKTIIGGIVFGLIVFGAIVGILWSAKEQVRAQASTTAILNIIEAPTQTLPAPTAAPTDTPGPTLAHNVPPPHGDIKVGDHVRVTGTEGDGLRLHATAGLTTDVDYVAIDAEVFLVKDGPVDTDGYTWWLLQDPFTDTVMGWGASNYLSVVQNP